MLLKQVQSKAFFGWLANELGISGTNELKNKILYYVNNDDKLAELLMSELPKI